jgi:hypothetical protein
VKTPNEWLVVAGLVVLSLGIILENSELVVGDMYVGD